MTPPPASVGMTPPPMGAPGSTPPPMNGVAWLRLQWAVLAWRHQVQAVHQNDLLEIKPKVVVKRH